LSLGHPVQLAQSFTIDLQLVMLEKVDWMEEDEEEDEKRSHANVSGVWFDSRLCPPAKISGSWISKF
jgi:hypothetical protein